MVRIKCPRCAVVLDVVETLRGQVCRCSACGCEVRIPPEKTLPPVHRESDPSILPLRAAGPSEDNAVFALEEVPTRPVWDAPLVLHEDVVEPLEKKRRRRTKGRRKRQAEGARRWRYYVGFISPFGWILLALVVLWLGSVGLALVSPDVCWGLTLAGQALVFVGNVWIAFIAFGDNRVYGVLCFFTCLFTYAYIFMNLEETWRPAALTGLGFLCFGSALVVSNL